MTRLGALALSLGLMGGACGAGAGGSSHDGQLDGAERVVTLVVDETRSGAATYVEGSYAYIRVEAEGGEVVVEKRLRDPRPLDDGVHNRTRLRLSPGTYRFVSYQRPCDGSCGLLDAPTDMCARTLTVETGARLAIALTPGRGCTMRVVRGTAAGAGGSTGGSSTGAAPATRALPPPEFRARDGWQTGSATSRDQAFAWAATRPFLNEPFEAPPGRTLAALSPDDLLIEVVLWRPTADQAVPSRRIDVPITLEAGAEGQDFPGSEGTRWFQRVGGAVNDHQVIDVWVFAGRERPTRAQVAEAQAMLNGLVVPDWPRVGRPS